MGITTAARELSGVEIWIEEQVSDVRDLQGGYSGVVTAGDIAGRNAKMSVVSGDV